MVISASGLAVQSINFVNVALASNTGYISMVSVSVHPLLSIIEIL